jgi:hypothetical protein
MTEKSNMGAGRIMKNNEMLLYFNGKGLEYLKAYKKDPAKEHIIKPENAVNHLQFPVFPCQVYK